VGDYKLFAGAATLRPSRVGRSNRACGCRSRQRCQFGPDNFLPRDLPTAAGSFIAVDVSVESEAHSAWRRPIRTHFRRALEGWTLVGLERVPDSPSQGPVRQTQTR
jgi:hypothetical protein